MQAPVIVCCSVIFLAVIAFNANERGPPQSRRARLPKPASNSSKLKTHVVSELNAVSDTTTRCPSETMGRYSH
jgi:hypothetical protein